jgi:CelD/BcsL family acetyltransferase involved in cellulose biosynthesis
MTSPADRPLGLTVLGPADLPGLREDWDALADRCPGRYLSQSWRWAMAAWAAVAAPRDRKLHIVALRAADRLVAVWPLISFRTPRLQWVRPLSSESSEYTSPLVEPGQDAIERMARLLKAAARFGDVLSLPHVRRDDAFTELLGRHRWRAYEDDLASAPWVDRREYGQWSDYLATISTSRLAGLRRKRRRLEERGVVSFRVEYPPLSEADIDRLFANKQQWMARHEISSAWLETLEYRAFLTALTAGADSRDGLTLFTLRLDGRAIAAQLNAVDGRRVEFLIGAFDEEWARYSPGSLLTEECLRWAFEHGFDYDFRIGAEPYKFGWTERKTITSQWRDGSEDGRRYPGNADDRQSGERHEPPDHDADQIVAIQRPALVAAVDRLGEAALDLQSDVEWILVERHVRYSRNPRCGPCRRRSVPRLGATLP